MMACQKQEAGGRGQVSETVPQGLKPVPDLLDFMYGLKPVPFKLAHYRGRRDTEAH